MRIVNAEQMRALDAQTIDELGIPGIVLMERAALGVVEAIRDRFPVPARAAVLVGPGNNGGDGSAAARLLHQLGWHVSILLASDAETLIGDAAANLRVAERLGLEIIRHDDIVVGGILQAADVWVDALLGTGLDRAPRGPVDELLRQAAEFQLDTDPWIVAVDIPSGAVADTGACPGSVMRASCTVTFALRKWGHVLPPARVLVGDLRVVDIGIPNRFADELGGVAAFIDQNAARSLWAPIPVIAHKGMLGHVLVIGGSDLTPGAAILGADAALHAGAGLVTVAGSKWMRLSVVAHRPELMTLDRSEIEDGVPDVYDTVVFGPGLGQSSYTRNLLEQVVQTIGDRPMVIDADGLNVLAEAPVDDMPSNVVLTPHPGELARLLREDIAAVVDDLVAATIRCAALHGAVVVAKTAGAVIVGDDIAFVDGGDPGMATAGSGDVLAGIIGALSVRLAIEDAAGLAAWLHAAAGRNAAQHRGSASLVAGAIIDALPTAFGELEGRSG